MPIENWPARFLPVSGSPTVASASSIRLSGTPRSDVRTRRFSRAVKLSYSGGDSMSAPISFKSSRVHGRPAKAISPEVGRSMPHSILSSVDFPAPF